MNKYPPRPGLKQHNTVSNNSAQKLVGQVKVTRTGTVWWRDNPGTYIHTGESNFDEKSVQLLRVSFVKK